MIREDLERQLDLHRQGKVSDNDQLDSRSCGDDATLKYKESEWIPSVEVSFDVCLQSS